MAEIPSVLTDTVDPALEGWLPDLQAAQENVLAQEGRYFQGLPTHDAPPADGNRKAPDFLDRKPSDRSLTWRQVAEQNNLTVPSGWLERLTVHEYVGPDGAGWVGVAEHIVAGQLWRRAINVGPEAYREQGWHQVTEEAP